MIDKRIIISLDFPEKIEAVDLARKIDPDRCRLKIGKELFTHYGPSIIEELQSLGFEIFLDLKFHDIPNTVAGACRSAAGLGVWMINVHALGGKNMLLAAREAIDREKQKPLLIAVTILTSMTNAELEMIGMPVTIEKAVSRLAGLALDAGLDGVVCSARESGSIRRQSAGRNFYLVTPGIRPSGSSQDDQARVVTPADAIRGGSHYLVVGRPVIRAVDPLKALEAIDQEVQNALAG